MRLLIIVLVVLGCGGSDAPPVTLVGVEVSPTTASLAAGTSRPLVATAIFTDQTTLDVTGLAAWTTSSTNVAVTNGLVFGVTPGPATITATYDGVSTSIAVVVTAAELEEIVVDPPNVSIPTGLAQQLTATGRFSDASTQDLTVQVSWTTSDASRVTVDSSGLATATGLGDASVTATALGVVGGTAVHATVATLVSIEVAPPHKALPRGTQQQLQALGHFSDASIADITEQVSWSTSDVEVASVSGTGLVAAVDLGTAAITATLGSIDGVAQVDVTAAVLVALQITPSANPVANGLGVQFTAVGTFTTGNSIDMTSTVLWESSVHAIASISNGTNTRGRVSTVGVGTTTITATAPNSSVQASVQLVVTGATLVSLEVSPATTSLPVGFDQRLGAIGHFTDSSAVDLTDQVTWSSTATAVASISNAAGSRGLVDCSAQGSATITAVMGSSTATASIECTPAVLVSLAISPLEPRVAKGFEVAFKATGTFSDASQRGITSEVTWESSATSVAISNGAGTHGVASTFGVGQVQISARRGSVQQATTLTVTPAVLVSIQLDPISPTAAKGIGVDFTATGTFSDGTTQDLSDQASWSSNNTFVASAIGRHVRTNNVGQAVIKATTGSPQISASTTLVVTPAELVTLAVSPSTASVPIAFDQQFVAIGTFTDASQRDLTVEVTWSCNATVATISPTGLATGVAAGSTAIAATIGSIVGIANLETQNRALQSITLAPAAPSLVPGVQQPFIATGNFSDASSLDLTQLVSWQSTDTTVATISNGPPTRGVLTTTGLGTTTIRATHKSITGVTTVLVIPPPPATITVTVAGSGIGDVNINDFTTGNDLALSCASTCSVTAPAGHRIRVTVSTPQAFEGFSNACSGGGPSCFFTATSGANEVGVTFSPVPSCRR